MRVFGGFAGNFVAISALRAAATRRLRSETRLRAAGRVPSCGAGFFLDTQKETKEAPGGELRWALRARIRPPPGPPLRGTPSC